MRKTVLMGSAALATLVVISGGFAMAQGMRHWQGQGPGSQLFERFDRSGDGRISQEDIDAVLAERFAEFDADGDGVLDLEEYQALWLDAMRTRMVRDFQRLDSDGDARLTEEEFLKPYARMVERFDRTGDGVVTREEIRETMRERREAMRQRHGGEHERRGPRGRQD